eukprot:CAMPEP_0198141512 /NCGR_PEP_ID=MMETSP1443-20131203/4502_1 /TAXON_ID=186043 /ORGANISM="Entomoneis sp., Strain CCMP2396" /LENGTH=424 /DNA_ID=CAMNT_0043804287 /DNA_START=52 /DNA_END=1326 /DNA_ORIENTATION=+
MGSSTSTESGPPPPKVQVEHDGYVWPKNMYEEMKDMAEVSFLIYYFAYLVNVARKDEEGNGNAVTGALDDLDEHVDMGTIVKRKFTPKQIETIVKDNLALLTDNKDFPIKPEILLESLSKLLLRVPDDKPDALTLTDFDDTYQKSELVYAIGKDDINKRITLVLRGTENSLAARGNWGTNASIWKTKVALPEVTKSFVKGEFDRVWIHSGFYKYAFNKTATTSDAESITKYEEILAELKPLIKEHPDYKVYVTGHSLGAAMASVFAFFLANEASDVVPKPVSCISFASPRVGDSLFLKACSALEENGQLRICRVVNDKDTITVVPSFNFFHVGFQVKLFIKEGDKTPPEPEISYPKTEDTLSNKFSRAWGNSVLDSLNLSYDHGAYRLRVKESEAALAAKNLNELYATRNDLTGFAVQYDSSTK